jgi:hypothetical protein
MRGSSPRMTQNPNVIQITADPANPDQDGAIEFTPEE